MSKFLFLIIPLCLVCLTPTIAYAGDAGESAVKPDVSAPAVPAPTAPAKAADASLDTVTELVKAVRSGNWRDAAGLVLILVMFAFGTVRERIKWFKGDRGGVIAVFSLSLAGALSASLLGDGPIDFKMFYTAILVAITAIGGFTAVKRVIWPKDKEE